MSIKERRRQKREEKEIRERRQAIKEQMEREQREQARKAAEQKRREAEAERKRQEEEERRQEEERLKQEKKQLAEMSTNELLVEILYEVRGLRDDIADFKWNAERIAEDNKFIVEKTHKTIEKIQENVDNIWVNTM